MSNQAPTYTQLAKQLRDDLQHTIARAWRGEEVRATIRVWQDGEVTTLVLEGQALIDRMRKLENDLVWEDVRRTCTSQLVHHSVQRTLAAALATA